MLKRDHDDAEIEELATKFRESWKEGQVIRSWLRSHSAELRKLVREEDWSWTNLGKALSAAGIQFKTGNGWTGENLRRTVNRAMLPRRGEKSQPQMLAPVPPATVVPAMTAAPPPRPPGEPEFQIIRRGPGTARAQEPKGHGTDSGQPKAR